MSRGGGYFFLKTISSSPRWFNNQRNNDEHSDIAE